MNKRLSAVMAVSLACAGLFIFSQRVKSDTAVTFNVVSGTDSTGTAAKVFSASEILELGASDNQRNGTSANWPIAGGYDESKYMEFTFAPSVPAGAVLSSVTVTHEYYTQATLSGAKLEVWNGSVFQDVPISLPSKTGSAGEISETKDIAGIISSPAQLSGLKIRFLAYRNASLGAVANLKTFHDYIGVTINYAIPTATFTPTPSDSSVITPTPLPSDIISPDASASATVALSPTPEFSVSPAPIYDTPASQSANAFVPMPTATPFDTLAPIPDILIASESDNPLASDSFETPNPSPTASPSFSPTPEATPSASFEPTPNPLMAVIAPPKIIHYRIKPTPLSSVSITPLPKPPSRIHKIKMGVINAWHLLTRYLNMIGR